MTTPEIPLAEINGKPIRISWSRVRETEECSEKAWQHHVMGARAPRADIRQFFRGTVADRCMRKWLESDDPQPGQMAAMCAEVLEREEKIAAETGDGVVRWKSLTDKRESIEWCQRLLVRLEPVLYQHVIPYDYQPAVRFEVPFTVPHPAGHQVKILLVGEMDIVVRWPDGQWVILDLKATEDTSYWRKTLAQLTFYEVAAFALSKGKWPAWSGLIQPACPEPVLPFQFTLENRVEIMNRIVRVSGDLLRGHHAPKADNAGCSYCYVRHACPRFAPLPGSKRVPVGS